MKKNKFKKNYTEKKLKKEGNDRMEKKTIKNCEQNMSDENETMNETEVQYYENQISEETEALDAMYQEQENQINEALDAMYQEAENNKIEFYQEREDQMNTILERSHETYRLHIDVHYPFCVANANELSYFKIEFKINDNDELVATYINTGEFVLLTPLYEDENGSISSERAKKDNVAVMWLVAKIDKIKN